MKPTMRNPGAGAAIGQAFGTLAVETRGRGMLEQTAAVQRWLADNGACDGLLTLFIRHTSASLLIQENADPDVQIDLIEASRTAGAARPPLRARCRGARRHAGAHQVGADGDVAVDPGARRGGCCSGPGRASTSSSTATARTGARWCSTSSARSALRLRPRCGDSGELLLRARARCPARSWRGRRRRRCADRRCGQAPFRSQAFFTGVTTS